MHALIWRISLIHFPFLLCNPDFNEKLKLIPCVMRHDWGKKYLEVLILNTKPLKTEILMTLITLYTRRVSSSCTGIAMLLQVWLSNTDTFFMQDLGQGAVSLHVIT